MSMRDISEMATCSNLIKLKEEKLEKLKQAQRERYSKKVIWEDTVMGKHHLNVVVIYRSIKQLSDTRINKEECYKDICLLDLLVGGDMPNKMYRICVFRMGF